MDKPRPPREPDVIAPAPPTKRNTVEKTGTKTTPDSQRVSTLSDPNLVTALVQYGTDLVSLFPKSVKAITIGSEVSRVNIVVASEYVSALHCKLERKGTTLRATDLSKNGTFFEGQRERWFYLRPGKTFIAGALPHCFLALNDPMRESYPELVDLLGAANEHVIGSLRDTPSPSDVIVAAVAGAPILITSEPDCDQHRLARIIHRVSRCCEREIVERTPKDLPADHKAQDELIKKRARRSTFVLDLGVHGEPLDPHFVAMLFKPRYQVRVVVLARSIDVVDKALGRAHAGKLSEIWLRPIASRPEAIDRLFDRVLEEHNSPLRMSFLTPENQEAIRNYSWPDNFASLRLAARRLTAIARLGTIHKAAHALGVGSSSLYHWYHTTLKLAEPLSRRLIPRDNRD
ncbi:MAG: FHA domain-containing protein [Deltaproteobacteria bacterium]|nr:MAG: FHA domain-containing protein [Deltaproteobacteria bacterium]